MELKKQDEKENKMGVMPIPKLVISMALPLMLSLLVQSYTTLWMVSLWGDSARKRSLQLRWLIPSSF